MSKQPEALIERLLSDARTGWLHPQNLMNAATELRRLHEENERLRVNRMKSLAKLFAKYKRLQSVNQELVEALKNLCDQLPSKPIPLSTYFAKDELLAARAALAKAQGESNE